jgi:hypothetical protein
MEASSITCQSMLYDEKKKHKTKIHLTVCLFLRLAVVDAISLLQSMCRLREIFRKCLSQRINPGGEFCCKNSLVDMYTFSFL